jgi:histidinol phosphatase-like PHP family hydrolase
LWHKRIPSEVAELIIRKLKERNVAVEMNYHHNDPSSEFLRSCIKANVTITPSSDAHQLKDIGQFKWFEQQLAGIKEPVSWIRI